MFSDRTVTRRPSALRPALIAMQSSPVSKKQLLISTSRQDSGSQPSVFGPSPDTWTCRSFTVTLVQRTGCTCHIGELRSLTPSIRTLVQRYGWMNWGLR